MIEVIPVLDIMNGLVVHAIAGRRKEYKPLKNSVLSQRPNPFSILKGLKNIGFRTIYIADLDAIMSRGNNRYVIDIALKMGFKVFADIGRKGLEYKDEDRLVYVIGTEYMLYPNEIRSLSNRVISLDMYDDLVIFRNTREKLDNVLIQIKQLNLKKILVIDLSRVGTESGVNKTIISKVVKYFPRKIIVGGGIRNEKDVIELKNIGVIGVLIATAIHKGIIQRPRY